MATNNKVKFVIPKLHEQFYAPSPSAQIMAEHFGDEPTPTLVEEDPFRVYVLVMYTTTSNENEHHNYKMYTREIHDSIAIQERVDAFRQFIDSQISANNLTGAVLKVYRINPMVSNTGMTMVTNYRKFEAKKDKVFLNGPLKNNEFLQKKGKMYAQN